ncbi:MAG: dihydrofolate reductase [Candidatus Peribacteraceae bacterium]|nr:dihydrofolate reductase [Candidatus Peribacteraceae bacterium]
MIISLIVAASENNVIGKDGRLPWSLPNDLKFFRERTEGKPVLMGRKTYESIGRPLPNRENIVITRRQGLKIPGCTVVHSLAEALKYCEERLHAKELFVIGGSEIFQQALPLANRVYLTRVHAQIEGDAFFPVLSRDDWNEVQRDEHAEDPQHLYSFMFQLFERRK